MRDWKSVPAIVTNAFGVVNLSDRTLRVVFGERLNESDEGNFHYAVQIDRRSAQMLIDLLQQTLGQGGAGAGGADEGGKGGGGWPGVIMGSTSVN